MDELAKSLCSIGDCINDLYDVGVKTYGSKKELLKYLKKYDNAYRAWCKLYNLPINIDSLYIYSNIDKLTNDLLIMSTKK